MNNATEYLKQQLQIKQADRDNQLALEQDNKDRERAIRECPSVKEEDFWCDECHTDFTVLAYKHVNWVFNIDTNKAEKPKRWRAWYEGVCQEGHRAIRRITDKQFDPYYLRSNWIRRQQVEHADDFLTPDDPRFRIKYPEQWARLQKQYGNPTGTTD